MELALLVKALLLAILCGVTEFLPVSSNGHVIIMKDMLHFEGPAGKLFEMSLQLGAICAVCWLYRVKLLHTLRGFTTVPADRKFGANVIIACIPAVIAGAAFHHFITEHLFNAQTVATMLFVGGILMLVIERFKPETAVHTFDGISFKTSLLIGLYQMLALIPGVSRSGATIMGALTLGVERRTATEFSFFLAIPMIFMASLFDLFLHRHELNAHGLYLLALGFVFSFAAAIIVVKWLLNYLTRHSFVAFAWYRIIFGGAVLLMLALA